MTDIRTGERRKPGRPRKFGQGRIKAAVRFTPKTYADIKATADGNGRSVSEEIEARIETLALLTTGASLAGAGTLSVDATVVHPSATLASKNNPEELLAKIMARIADLEKALNEEMIERAVLKALGKVRLTTGRDDAVEGGGT